ncbi:MAG: tRNA (guanosine(37)-N1)-methyltransferase TrmD [Holosporales bacterium]|jgi:tRNA (guanine37-N1)-methyltransferase
MSPSLLSPFSVTVVTLFPQMFPGPLGAALLGEALDRGLWQLNTVNIRDFASDAYRSVDDEAFGGGPGMVLRPDVVGSALDEALSGLETPRVICLTPRGVPLQQEHLQTWAQERRPLVFLCGRYEGIDQRVSDFFGCDEISLGDFVLMGGEVAAMVAIEGCVRLLEGVLGNQSSLASESFACPLLEYPQYTRPRLWRGWEVPPILLSGHHAKIHAWRQEEAEILTQKRRPDLWARFQKEKS